MQESQQQREIFKQTFTEYIAPALNSHPLYGANVLALATGQNKKPPLPKGNPGGRIIPDELLQWTHDEFFVSASPMENPQIIAWLREGVTQS